MTYNIFFSPTGSTEKISKYTANKFEDVKNIDLSDRNLDDKLINSDDFCIFALPSFGGRIPNIARKRLEKIRGNENPTLLLITYGGRAYDDSLNELQLITKNQGFKCIAKASIVSRHSIAPKIANDRPNKKDYEKIDNFIENIKKNIKKAPLDINKNISFKEYNVMPMDVKATASCVKCGICAKNCPVGAIDVKNPNLTDNEKCISCMRCVYICPFKAREVNKRKVDMIFNKLKEIYKPTLEDEFFL